MFRSSTIIRELVLSLAKVILKQSKTETCRSDMFVNSHVNFTPFPV
jgi:hypothetical protein